MPKTIALVEDDAAIRENYIMALKAQGYSVNAYEDRPSAAEAFNHTLPDLAIIDIGLKDEIEGGFMLCQQLRGLSQTLPIIFFTARDNDVDTISGLRMGADDYLTKDISMAHLLARIAALFRRTDLLAAPTEQKDDALIKRPGHVKSRQQLMDESRMVVDDTTITSHIKRMRKKFVQLDPNFDHIDTVYGMGYRWQL
jgi:two-component system OmpR family response regulator